jgi:hypothetical protein
MYTKQPDIFVILLAALDPRLHVCLLAFGPFKVHIHAGSFQPYASNGADVLS